MSAEFAEKIRENSQKLNFAANLKFNLNYSNLLKFTYIKFLFDL